MAKPQKCKRAERLWKLASEACKKRLPAAFIGASRRRPQHYAAQESSVLDEGPATRTVTTRTRSPLRRSTAPAMPPRRNPSTFLPSTLLLPLLHCLLFLPLALAQNLNVYHFPDCAQACANDIFPTGCLQTDDSCICANIPYLDTIANCIGLSCDETGLTASADVFLTDCAASGAEFAMSEAQFVAAGDGDQSAASSSAVVAAPSSGFVTSTVEVPAAASSSTVEGATRTSAAPVPTPTETGTGGGGKGFTLDQKIALGCGIGIGLPGTLATIWMCLRQR